MRSSNPVFANLEKRSIELSNAKTVTYNGITAKTLLLLAIAVITGFFSPLIPAQWLYGILIFSGIASILFVVFALMWVKTAWIFSLLYAVTQGVAYGLITWIAESFFPGVGITAITGTGVIFGVMMLLYYTGLLRATPLFRKMVLGTLISVLVVSLILTIVFFTNPGFAVAFQQNFGLSVGISLFLILLGAFMLILDFDRADRAVQMGLPKAYEWQVALGFMVTIVWIYVEMLRLAIIIAGRDR